MHGKKDGESEKLLFQSDMELYAPALTDADVSRMAIEVENLELSIELLKHENTKYELDRVGREKERDRKIHLKLEKSKLMMDLFKFK